jgi:hypothetical protein
VEISQVKNITISKRAEEICQSLMSEGFVNSAIEAYKMAVVIALDKKLVVDRDVKFDHGNKWDTASVFFDRDSNLEPILLLHGIDQTNLVVEGKYLAEAGLRYLEEKRLSNEDVLSYLIGSSND